MTKKILFFLISVFIIFITSFTYLVFSKNDQASNISYYKVSNTQLNDITTISHKEAWKQVDTINLLANNKINGNFTGKTDNLGIISIPFDTHNKSINDTIIFRLKEVGQRDWYYQASYDAKQFQNNIPFPFGFPVITNSKNKSYTFQLESVNGKIKDSLSISKTNSYFFTKYKFPKAELEKNPYLLLKFFVAKINEQLSLLTNREIAFIFIFSISFPLIILKVRKQHVGGIRSLLLKFFRKYKIDLVQERKIKENYYRDILLGFLITFSLIAFIVLLVGVLSLPLTGQRKWIPYLSILIPSALLSLNILKIKIFNKGYFTILAGFLSSAIITLGFIDYQNFTPIGYEHFSLYGVGFFLLVGCYICILPLLRYFSFVFAGTLVFLFGINSVVFINNFEGSGFMWTAFLILVVMLAFLFSLNGKNGFGKWVNINKVFFAVIMLISSILAFRSDSLFLGSAEFHWNYFTSVIQTIRSGGELLWSAPSQYGFLNILLPSLLPWTSRNSFFIFQAILFIICTFIFIKVVYACFKNKPAFVVIALSALSLFYFADPALIGPALFPSSSAVRFFCIYILIYAILLQHQRRTISNGGVKWLVAIAYIIGALWSAESMFYSTVIYGVYLVASAISMFREKINNGLRFLLINVSVVLIALIFVNILYLVILGHFPDWSMFFLYASNYAGGFGELPIAFWGIQWAVIIALCSIIYILWRLRLAKKDSEWIIISVCFISLWALGSYYVGRAVTNNLTAILPLIFYIFIVMLSVLTESKFFMYRLLLTSVFLPWVVVGIMGGIGNPQFLDKLQQFKYAENINSKSFKPDKELGGILESLGAERGTRIVYYGDLYGNPVIPLRNGGYMDPAVGLPMPLSLLEEPIPTKNRDIIIERYLAKLNEPTFLLHRKGVKEERFLVWEKFLEQKYFFEKKYFASKEYDVFLVKHK